MLLCLLCRYFIEVRIDGSGRNPMPEIDGLSCNPIFFNTRSCGEWPSRTDELDNQGRPHHAFPLRRPRSTPKPPRQLHQRLQFRAEAVDTQKASRRTSSAANNGQSNLKKLTSNLIHQMLALNTAADQFGAAATRIGDGLLTGILKLQGALSAIARALRKTTAPELQP